MEEIRVEMDCGDYFINIGCIEIHAFHDRQNHRWIFLDYTGKKFFAVSEKKGECIIDFLKALTNLKCEKIFVSQG